MLKFITGNKTKVLEAKAALSPLEFEQLDINLTEVQDLDPKIVIAHKLKEAAKHHKGSFFIDDSSLFLECFNYQLPGPLIKAFNQTIGGRGMYDLAEKTGKVKARAITIIGLMAKGKIKFFEGELTGKIIKPRGNYKFGYDQIFVPKGQKFTLSELKSSGDFYGTPRGLALKKLKKYLLSKKPV